MNYCLLNEAWDPKFTGIEQNYTKSNQWCPEETSANKSCNTLTQNESKVEHFSQDNNIKKIQYLHDNNDCMNILDHIKTCSGCRNKIKININDNQFLMVDNIRELINNNKDIIVLALIGMFILLFFNLVNNITKD